MNDSDIIRISRKSCLYTRANLDQKSESRSGISIEVEILNLSIIKKGKKANIHYYGIKVYHTSPLQG